MAKQELQNLFSIGGTDYGFAVDATPTENSDAFVLSGAMYNWVVSLTPFAGRQIEASKLSANDNNIPTVGLVYSEIQKLQQQIDELNQ